MLDPGTGEGLLPGFSFMWLLLTECALRHRVGQSGYPLRTVRESFPSYGSSLSKDISYVACPGWFSFPEFKSIAVSIVKGSEMTNGKGVGDD